ncbi:hypothetical protein GBA52_018658 [Prunus armeniaca]|nr:hypothetical protein GBA52_018658 [Prunus armeniaca]
MEGSTKRETREKPNSVISVLLALGAPNATTLTHTKNGTKCTRSSTKTQSDCILIRPKLLSQSTLRRKRKQEAAMLQQHEEEQEDEQEQELKLEHEHECKKKR